MLDRKTKGGGMYEGDISWEIPEQKRGGGHGKGVGQKSVLGRGRDKEATSSSGFNRKGPRHLEGRKDQKGKTGGCSMEIRYREREKPPSADGSLKRERL